MASDACAEMALPAVLPDPSARLCAAFEHIGNTRMQGLPFLNPALRVEAVGFQPWKEFWLGVIVTPWMMNLMLLPRESEHWPTIERGDRLHYPFPAGDYDFIMAHDASFGEYMMCSLFSPMQQFGDHETARQTAEFALKMLFEDDVPETSGEEKKRPTLQEKMATPLSKRDFLRGRFLNKETTK
ncbi:MAG: [NiFe]-hydrogenase assembly chaperone HybE [Proteobacteria bacterium]|nr:[NiFe]-hydrogenase assembly chaperone HybE [Pseudomonadota bacterium]MCL2307925.1 [NiFe]-hydrogenase assembly chaperone HybE [Pseudomonadota bacterium]